MQDVLGRSNSPHAQLEVYSSLRGTHKAQLHTIWRDLEVPEETQAQELSSIDARACRVWTSAVIQVRYRKTAGKYFRGFGPLICMLNVPGVNPSQQA